MIIDKILLKSIYRELGRMKPLKKKDEQLETAEEIVLMEKTDTHYKTSKAKLE